MAIRVRFQYPTGAKLGISIEQLSTEQFYDWKEVLFSATPAQLIIPIVEDKDPFLGRYIFTVKDTPKFLFSNGDYVITVHDLAPNGIVVAELACTMFQGDDSTVFPQIWQLADLQYVTPKP